MQVILLDDIERVGHEGDVMNVADGFARNYLIPRNLAVQASRGALQDLERRRKAIAGREADKAAKAQTVADELSGKLITVSARAGQGTRLHGQVTPHMIAEAAKAQIGMELDRRDIDIAEPIRDLGDYLISVKIYKTVAAQLPLHVVREGGDEPVAPEPPAKAAPVEEPAAEEAPAEAEAATEEPAAE